MSSDIEVNASDDTGDWEAAERRLPAADALIVDVDGFEGPLDLLLTLARDQKVDLTRISILALANQYLEFVKAARAIRLELAADYLVMAAWLAYLKSRLLLPEPEGEDEPSGEELAALLAFRLQRLDAMRQAAAQLMARNRLGRDVFGRGDPDAIEINTQREQLDNLYDLLKAYAERRQRGLKPSYVMKHSPVWTIKEARRIIERLIGKIDEWGRFDDFLMEYLVDPAMQSTVKASSFTASLELIRDGTLDFRQDGAFAPLYLRRKPSVAG